MTNSVKFRVSPLTVSVTEWTEMESASAASLHVVLRSKSASIFHCQSTMPLNAETGYGVAIPHAANSLIRRQTETPSTRTGAAWFRAFA